MYETQVNNRASRCRRDKVIS